MYCCLKVTVRYPPLWPRQLWMVLSWSECYLLIFGFYAFCFLDLFLIPGKQPQDMLTLNLQHQSLLQDLQLVVPQMFALLPSASVSSLKFDCWETLTRGEMSSSWWGRWRRSTLVTVLAASSQWCWHWWDPAPWVLPSMCCSVLSGAVELNRAGLERILKVKG